VHAGLTYAVGIALSPLPVVIALLLASGASGPPATLSYLLGVTAGTTLATVVIVTLVSALGLTDAPGSTDTVRVTLGVVLVAVGLAFLAARRRLRRIRWLDLAADLQPPRAAAVGFVLPLVNAKNLPLMFAAAVEVVAVGRPVGGAVMIVGVSVAGVLAAALVGLAVPRTGHGLRLLRRRLARWEVEIAAGVCLALGAKLVLDGL
jgi:threonine/homoserine/homoserine lactone efflux protein